MLIPRTRPSTAHLEWRVRLFGAGAILAMVGIWFEARWLINVAIGVLLLGLALRFFPERRSDREADPDGPVPPA